MASATMRWATNGLSAIIALAAAPAAAAQPSIAIDLNAPSHAFPHYWEQMFGSGRAILSLRDSYRRDLREVKQVTDFKYVRFHAIFHDEIGFYDEDNHGNPIYNFSYIDQIYDGLLENGVRPFVELSFMPNKLAAKPAAHAFWYKPNTSSPKDYAKWDAMIAVFARHLIERYGADEVASWYFEVWNEPNLDFWSGRPSQQTYWDLYDHTALALKGVDRRLRVGGPATAQAAWVDAFITHVKAMAIPVDFVSTHVYGDDSAEDVFGTTEIIPREDMVCRAVKKVHDQITASALPALPLIWSEFNATYTNRTDITDAAFMGPWLAETISKCDGLVDSMSYWSFSDVFEEQGVVKTPLYGGYGLIAVDGLPKPAYNAFKILHTLGDTRIVVKSDQVLATRRADGALVLAVWNYAPPEARSNTPITLELRLKHSHATTALISRVDSEHGDLRAAYAKMGSPPYPTMAQIKILRDASILPEPQSAAITNGVLSITLPIHGLAVVEVR